MDFIAIFGNDFPRTRNILASKSYDEDSSLSFDILPTGLNNKCTSSMGSGKSTEELSSTQRDEDSVGCSSERCEVEDAENSVQENLIRVLLEPHEGQEISSSPYNVVPKQMVCLDIIIIVSVVWYIEDSVIREIKRERVKWSSILYRYRLCSLDLGVDSTLPLLYPHCQI